MRPMFLSEVEHPSYAASGHRLASIGYVPPDPARDGPR
jgi:hypothetical protein